MKAVMASSRRRLRSVGSIVGDVYPRLPYQGFGVRELSGIRHEGGVGPPP